MSFLGQQAMVRRVIGGGSWTGGVYVLAGGPVDTSFAGTWRPMTGRDLERLPEGERERDPRVLYTKETLGFGGQNSDALADQVSPDGGSSFYEVFNHGDSTDSLPASPIAHNKYKCLRLKQTDPDP